MMINICIDSSTTIAPAADKAEVERLIVVKAKTAVPKKKATPILIISPEKTIAKIKKGSKNNKPIFRDARNPCLTTVFIKIKKFIATVVADKISNIKVEVLINEKGKYKIAVLIAEMIPENAANSSEHISKIILECNSRPAFTPVKFAFLRIALVKSVPRISA